MRPLGISYSRFSTPDQAEGDTTRRQSEMFTRFCERHELTPSPEAFADPGVSGFRGKHRSRDLGKFIDAAKAGRFPQGSVLVVEAWDRLSRERPDRVIALVSELLSTGVAIGICRMDDVFHESDFGSHKFTTLAVFVQMAHQESVQKGERVASAKAAKVKRIREGKPIDKHVGELPAWVRDEEGKLELVPEVAAFIKLAFALAIQGLGQVRILRQLNANGAGWKARYLAKVLQDRRVLGEFTPKGGEPIMGYYPRIISDEEWAAARAGAKARKVDREMWGGKIRPVNIFRGLLKEAREGCSFFLNNHGSDKLILQNSNSVNKERGSKLYSVPYHPFEAAILGLLRELDPRKLESPSGPDPSLVLQGKLEEAKAKHAKAVAVYNADPDPIALEGAKHWRAEVARLEGELTTAKAKALQAPSEALGGVQTLSEALATAKDPESVRARIRALLRGCIETLQLLIVPVKLARYCACRASFPGGGSRLWLLKISPRVGGHSPSPGRWWAFSAKHPKGKEGDWGWWEGNLVRLVDKVVSITGESEGEDKMGTFAILSGTY